MAPSRGLQQEPLVVVAGPSCSFEAQGETEEIISSSTCQNWQVRVGYVKLHPGHIIIISTFIYKHIYTYF